LRHQFILLPFPYIYLTFIIFFIMKKTAIPLYSKGFRFVPIWVWGLVLLVACQRENLEPDLPPETATGANTFGCILNGQPWKTTPNVSGQMRTLIAQPDNGGLLNIYATHKGTDNSRWEGIQFFSVNFYGTGKFPISKHLDNRFSFEDMAKNIYINSKSDDVKESGELIITTFDTNKGILAGRFWFRLEREDGTVYEAKDGRFDISLR
jgi:hypothetical protein